MFRKDKKKNDEESSNSYFKIIKDYSFSLYKKIFKNPLNDKKKDFKINEINRDFITNKDDFFQSNYFHDEVSSKNEDDGLNKIRKSLMNKTDEEFNLIGTLKNKYDSFFNDLGISDESKPLINGLILVITCVFIISTFYYFAVHIPENERFESTRLNKLNELNSLYVGPLAGKYSYTMIKSEIDSADNIEEILAVNILNSATKEWRYHHKIEINTNKDEFDRIMLKNPQSSTVIMEYDEAIAYVASNDANILSKVSFEKVDTVAVPIKVNRLQAGAGLLEEGDIVNMYFKTDNKSSKISDSNATNIKGLTIISVLRSESSGKIESEFLDSDIITKGNESQIYKTENQKSTDVENLLKVKLVESFRNMNIDLYDYGIDLSANERESNLADLETEYMILIEVPKENVQYVLNNMDNIILTIPTNNAPEWILNSLKLRYS